ncbi:protein-L-isoaspartate(D-aspartate) O-methyltransferase [Calidifontimicrobium sp. SYSU G02091]|uniref:protein-L-isoaspartate(D-aspartate) O-methyltransferase n=1 Tax=Calidifontimicrobium sp. SYSU G02091 TaxID=2926421 RepID=UPI001F536746|nr:protein-L-isoaspartate(D-aspartate) O-methyltransferase [Calidifontimicrobium sp. SYSU G02091]
MSGRPPRFPLSLERVAPASAAPVAHRPQRLLAEASKDARRQRSPSGVGLDSAGVRSRMVQRLQAGGVRHVAVLQAFADVPRHHFVDSALVPQAYEDTALPIGHGQTISKPSVIARMLELLLEGRPAGATAPLGRTLEIGTGCGYQAALLSRLARHVVSVERLRPLHELARERLAAWPRANLRLVWGDGMLGHAPNAPYDSIIAAAGGDDLPSAWLDQLAVGGRLVAPVRAADGRGQTLVVVERHATGLQRRLHEAVQFVPLKSGVA